MPCYSYTVLFLRMFAEGKEVIYIYIYIYVCVCVCVCVAYCRPICKFRYFKYLHFSNYFIFVICYVHSFFMVYLCYLVNYLMFIVCYLVTALILVSCATLKVLCGWHCALTLLQLLERPTLSDHVAFRWTTCEYTCILQRHSGLIAQIIMAIRESDIS